MTYSYVTDLILGESGSVSSGIVHTYLVVLPVMVLGLSEITKYFLSELVYYIGSKL